VRIDETARDILETVGLTDLPPPLVDRVLASGGRLTEQARLTFPRALVDEVLAGLQRGITLCGQTPTQDMELAKGRVFFGSGGAAPSVVDLDSGRYRDSRLEDLHDAARLVDSLDNVHFFSRSLVARDMPDAYSLDINTAYASLAGTAKHVATSASHPSHVTAIAELCHAIAGSEEAFRARPFLSLNVNHVTPPLRFAAEACEVLAEAVRLGIPVHLNTFGQLGASSPVTVAGSLAQTLAETLAGVAIAWILDPEAKAIFGPRPMVTDLRTGGMSGGGGEQALLMAASAQMAGHYGLPNSCIAGATDSKLPDAQSGYEKALTVTLAAQAGANLVTQACGMQAGLMGVSFESYVIDNDMLGAIARSLSEIEVSQETLSNGAIAEIALGEGHFLGHPQTLARMQSDFLYPSLADRRSPEAWEAEGAKDIREVARQRAKDILATHFPGHLTGETDRTLRAAFDIRLPETALRPP
jgi:trimethylamine--corrinoid protein Co-methyltransferase